MKKADLPDKYFDLFAQPYLAGGDTDANELFATVIKDYFGHDPAPDTDTAYLAGYNAFGASEQAYFPDVPYAYDSSDIMENFPHEVPDKAMRLYKLLTQSAVLGCNILFSAPGRNGNPHVAGLELIDVDSALYVVRNTNHELEPFEHRLYNAWELAGFTSAIGGYSDEYAPLPEFARPHYPAGETSWELTVFPPEPQG